ncbi:MAG: rod shape-determining protein MreD [Anaerolineae bacterium]
MALPVLLLLAILQVTLMPSLAIGNLRPDLVLAAVVCWALYRGATDGAAAGFVAGLSLDLLAGSPFGIHGFVMAFVGVTAGFAAALLPSEHVLLLPGVAVLCTLVQQASYVYLLRAAGWPLHWSQVLLTVALPASALNLLLTAALYPVVGRLGRRDAPAEQPGW